MCLQYVLSEPFCDGGHVLAEVHDGQDGEEADPGLLQLVDDGRPREDGAALGGHALVARFHVLSDSLKMRKNDMFFEMPFCDAPNVFISYEYFYFGKTFIARSYQELAILTLVSRSFHV
jgi:hypothetical protein